LTKASRNLVELVARWGEPEGPVDPFAPDECWALRRGRAHQSGEGRLEPPCEHGCQRGKGQSFCVPMMAHGESIGVFRISTLAPGFNETERHLVHTIAERIGLALANLRLRDALRLLSVRDPLTGLFNRRYMEEASEREMRRSTRHQTPLGVVMIDIDHFKRFNDTYGHEAGDALLREFGTLVRAQTRREDIACRYGGEEFLLILPEADAVTTAQCAEKLRRAMEHLSVDVNGQAVGQVTASFGVAAFPEHSDSFTALVRIADKALYAAKSAGRNRVSVPPGLHVIAEPERQLA
jgi:diguanylate cyclase (GGDEF)-like protein